MTFTPEQIKSLSAPLDPKHIKPPKKFGPKGDYIEGWHAISEANRIFGFDGWSYTVDLIRDDVSLGKDNDGNDQWQAAYTCICTVEAGGVKRQDVGFGSGFAKKVGDAIEGATKEAVTDGLKRCLRTFGHPFGLALYDKDRANVSAPPVEMFTDAMRDEIAMMAQGAGVSLGKLLNTYNTQNNADAASLKDLPATEFEPMKKGLQAIMEKRAAKQKEPA